MDLPRRVMRRAMAVAVPIRVEMVVVNSATVSECFSALIIWSVLST